MLQLAGWLHTCGFTTTGDAYCWGLNDEGQLGTSSDDELCAREGWEAQPVSCETSPVPVSGGLTFASLAAGGLHTCGMASAGVYCWGWNVSGQLGNGSLISSSQPIRTSGQP